MVGVSLILVATNTSPDVARAARHLPTPAIALQTNTSSGTVRSGAAFAPSRRRDKTRQSKFRTATIIGLRVYLLSAERLTFSGLGRGNLPRDLTQPTDLRGGWCRASMGPMDNVPFAPLFVRDPRLAPRSAGLAVEREGCARHCDRKRGEPQHPGNDHISNPAIASRSASDDLRLMPRFRSRRLFSEKCFV